MNLWLQWRQIWDPNRRILKVNIVGETLILRESDKSDISHPMEVSLEDSYIVYNICGQEVVSLQPLCLNNKI